MPKHPHRFVRTAAEEQTREPLGFMKLKEVARHFAVSETTIRLGRGKFACLRKSYVCGSVNEEGYVRGARVLIVREDVMSLSKRLEREAMCATEVCATEREHQRERNEAYRIARKTDG